MESWNVSAELSQFGIQNLSVIFDMLEDQFISEWVAALNGGVRLATLAASVHPYPTLGEINKRVAGNFMATKLFSDTVKRGLRFFFSLRGRACESP